MPESYEHLDQRATRLLRRTITAYVADIHARSKNAGWWEGCAHWQGIRDGRLICEDKTTLAMKIALIHSEVSEMLEGLRKGLDDSHLPDRSAEEVECADILIRLLDYAGARGFDLEGAVVDKLDYNEHRADHKPEARNAEGGKAF